MRLYRRLHEEKLPVTIAKVFPFLTDGNIAALNKESLTIKMGSTLFFVDFNPQIGFKAFKNVTPCLSSSPEDISAKLGEVQYSTKSRDNWKADGAVLYFNPKVEIADVNISSGTKTIKGDGLKKVKITSFSKNIKVILPKEVDVVIVNSYSSLDLSNCNAKKFVKAFAFASDAVVTLPPGKDWEDATPSDLSIEGTILSQAANEKEVLANARSSKIKAIKNAGDLGLLNAINDELDGIALIEMDSESKVLQLKSLSTSKIVYLFNGKMKNLRKVYDGVENLKPQNEKELLDIFIANGEIEPTLDLKKFYKQLDNSSKYIIPDVIENIKADDSIRFSMRIANKGKALESFLIKHGIQYPTTAVFNARVSDPKAAAVRKEGTLNNLEEILKSTGLEIHIVSYEDKPGTSGFLGIVEGNKASLMNLTPIKNIKAKVLKTISEEFEKIPPTNAQAIFDILLVNKVVTSHFFTPSLELIKESDLAFLKDKDVVYLGVDEISSLYYVSSGGYTNNGKTMNKRGPRIKIKSLYIGTDENIKIKTGAFALWDVSSYPPSFRSFKLPTRNMISRFSGLKVNGEGLWL